MQFHASTEHKLLFNYNSRHPFLGARKWIWKDLNWASELGFFSLDSCSSKPTGRERFNWAYKWQCKLATGGKVEFQNPQVQMLFIQLVVCSVYTLQGKAVDGGNLCAEKFFFVLYCRHTGFHSWWYKPRYHHWTRNCWGTDRGMLMISWNCGGPKDWLCSVQILYTFSCGFKWKVQNKVLKVWFSSVVFHNRWRTPNLAGTATAMLRQWRGFLTVACP